MLLTSILLAAPALPASLPLPAPHGDLRITEFLADNNGGHLDEDGEDSDWIEITNVGVSAADLAGWHLTDDLADLTKWTFPTQALASGARIVVFASDKDRAVPGSELHTNFKLTASGEPLALVQPDLTISSAYQPTFPQQLENISYGLRDSAAEEGYFSPPTPGAPNGDTFASLSPVEFSEPRGLKSAPFSLILSHPEPGASLLYTLDGDDPSLSGTPYVAPIPITATTIVRAVATKPVHTDSPPVTFSYLFPADVLIQSDSGAVGKGFHPQWIEDDGTNWNLGGTRPGAWYGMDQVVLGQHTNQELLDGLAALPSVSLTLPEEDWFGNGDVGETPGIYCNSFDAGDFWDRPGSAEWIDPSGGPEFQVNCGIAIQGGSSTNLAIRNQLSIAMKFREELGVSKLPFAAFGDRGLQEYDLLILDAGSQLSPNGPGGANQKVHAMGLRDQFMSDLQHEFGALSPAGTFVHLYLNGLYWGVYNLHERIDDNHSSAYQGGEPEEYDWIREGQVREGNGNDWDDPQPGLWDTAVEIAKNGVTPGDLWQGQDAYTALSEVFDVEDYADYLILNYYGGNTDWPQNNWMGTIHARNSANFGDVNPEGKFIWHCWDAETVLYWGGSETAVGDGFYDRTSLTATWEGSAVFFYTNLRHNPEWRMLFADRAHQHLFHGALYVDPAYAQAGTPFDPEHPERNRPAATFNRLVEMTEPAIALEWARWGNYWDSPAPTTRPTG